jgi:4-amino-4-deoxy-L-arabinose transferase-like glycosyltransferase
VLFFVLLGLTNLAKGPLVGALPIVATIGVYLLWNCDVRRIRHYAWLWGLLIFLVLTAAWPWWAQRHYPDIWDNWRFDYLGQFEGGDAAAGHQWDEPWWYYPMMLPLALAPWSWATVIGLFATARRAWKVPRSPERLLWCWAWMGLIVLSLPARKHHHYLVPVSTPWAILGALGLLPVARALFRGASGDLPQRSHRPGFGLLVFGVPGALALALLHRKMPGGAGAVALLIGAWMGCVWMFFNGLSQRNGRWLVGAVVAGVIVSGALIQIAIAGRDDATLAELKFLRQVEAAVPAGEPVLLNSDIGSLKFFRLQFYLQREGRLLHNLSFLRNQGLAAPVVYVITRAKDQPSLERIGTTQLIAQTDATRRERSVGQRFSLFRVTLSPDLRRYETPSYVGVMQAMGRKRGPWCGDDWGKALPGG